MEIQKMEEILPFIENDSLVVFDLDNTLFAAKQMLGSDQWFSYLENKYLTEGLSNSEAGERAVREVQALHLKTEVDLVEISTKKMMEDLQKRGVKVMALTARSPGLAFRTREQLKSVGLSFDSSAPVSGVGTLSDIPNSMQLEGVLYVGSSSKGDVLEKYLKRNGLRPSSVIFVDDKLYNSKSVEDFLGAKNYPIKSFRYGGADNIVEGFDAELAEAANAHFLKTGKIISDSTARRLRNRTRGGCENDFSWLFIEE